MRRDPENDRTFLLGDAIIRRRLAELAARRGLVYETVERQDGEVGDYVYRLGGSTRSVSFRAKDIRFAADPRLLATRIEPRLEAMFEDLWWRQAVTLMAATTGN